MKVREIQLAFMIIAFLSIGRQAVAGEQNHLTRDMFSASEKVLDDIEKNTNAAAVKEDIAVARRYLEHGNLLLRAGHRQKAALFSERLQLQIELLRALLAAAFLAQSAEQTERDTLRLEAELKSLKERRRRLLKEKQSNYPNDTSPSTLGAGN